MMNFLTNIMIVGVAEGSDPLLPQHHNLILYDAKPFAPFIFLYLDTCLSSCDVRYHMQTRVLISEMLSFDFDDAAEILCPADTPKHKLR